MQENQEILRSLDAKGTIDNNILVEAGIV